MTSKRIDDFVAAAVKGTQKMSLWAERCELLEACEDLITHVYKRQHGGDMCKICHLRSPGGSHHYTRCPVPAVKAAIAKARGE